MINITNNLQTLIGKKNFNRFKLIAFLSFITYPRPEIFSYFNFFAFINSMCRLIEASEIKKNIARISTNLKNLK